MFFLVALEYWCHCFGCRVGVLYLDHTELLSGLSSIGIMNPDHCRANTLLDAPMHVNGIAMLSFSHFLSISLSLSGCVKASKWNLRLSDVGFICSHSSHPNLTTTQTYLHNQIRPCDSVAVNDNTAYWPPEYRRTGHQLMGWSSLPQHSPTIDSLWMESDVICYERMSTRQSLWYLTVSCMSSHFTSCVTAQNIETSVCSSLHRWNT